MRWLKHRNKRMQPSIDAEKKSERLSLVIEHQVKEAQEVSTWAKTTLERNGLASFLFSQRHVVAGKNQHIGERHT